jgi:tRNA1Val (adenine37-N6)-methyltransferase
LNSTDLLRPGERLDDLQNNGLRILQKPGTFRFGMDAVLLAHFARLRPGDRVADMGTGTGILPLLMSQSEPTARFFAFEWQPEMADMAHRSVALNGLEERITVYGEDFRNAAAILGHGSMTAAVCNPPYGKRGGTCPNPTEEQRLSRHETECGLSDVIGACAAVLENRGRLWMVFPAPRALELMDTLREKRLEPKRIRLVCAKADRPPYLVLIEAVKNARPALQWMPPLIACREDGKATDELRALYGNAE